MHNNKLPHDKSFDTSKADNTKRAVMLSVSLSVLLDRMGYLQCIVTALIHYKIPSLEG